MRRYLAYRRSLGYRMHGAELLLDFARFADANAPNKPLMTSLAIQWDSASPSTCAKTRVKRLGMVRGFVRHSMLALRFRSPPCSELAFNAVVPTFTVLPSSR